jgi:hypothetical protein
MSHNLSLYNLSSESIYVTITSIDNKNINLDNEIIDPNQTRTILVSGGTKRLKIYSNNKIKWWDGIVPTSNSKIIPLIINSNKHIVTYSARDLINNLNDNTKTNNEYIIYIIIVIGVIIFLFFIGNRQSKSNRK